jgi:hypothetical protein
VFGACRIMEIVTTGITKRCQRECRCVQNDVIPPCFLSDAVFMQPISAVLSGLQQDNTVYWTFVKTKSGLQKLQARFEFRFSNFEVCTSMKIHVLFLCFTTVCSSCLSTAICCTMLPLGCSVLTLQLLLHV